MLQLVFKTTADESFELYLASLRYQKFWQENRGNIIASFRKHTDLDFTQKRISVRIIDERTSRAGNKHKPMELTRYREDESSAGANLLHELAHRLLIGNGIDTNAKNWNYVCHQHIYLFLFDVWKDVLGEKPAKESLDRERTNTYDVYKNAWDWALNQTYEQRQQKLEKLKRSYSSE